MGVGSSEFRLTAKLSGSLILGNFAFVMIATTDALMAGWLGATDLAAATLSQNIYYLAYLITGGFMLAATPFMASAMTVKRHRVEEVRLVVGSSLQLALVLCLVAWGVLLHSDAIYQLLGQSKVVSRSVGVYMKTLQWGLFPALAFIVLRNFVSIFDRPNFALRATFVAMLFNIIANWVLMFGHWGFPKLGLVGAGIASTLTNVLMLLYLLYCCMADRRAKVFKIWTSLVTAPNRMLLHLIKLGAPISGAQGAEMFMFFSITIMVGKFGASALAAHGICMQVMHVIYNLPLGISQAATVRVALAASRSSEKAVNIAAWTAYRGAFFLTLFFSFAIVIFAKPLASLFLDPSDPMTPEAIEYASSFIVIVGLFHVFDGGQIVGMGILRGIRNTRIPFMIGLVANVLIGVPMAFLLSFHTDLGVKGVWIGAEIGLAVICITLFCVWRANRARGYGLLK